MIGPFSVGCIASSRAILRSVFRGESAPYEVVAVVRHDIDLIDVEPTEHGVFKDILKAVPHVEEFIDFLEQQRNCLV